MNSETYLNHPTFGLLFRVCQVEEKQELFTTLYAQRLFFIVTNDHGKLTFDTISRSDARLLVENRLRKLRRSSLIDEYEGLSQIHKKTF